MKREEQLSNGFVNMMKGFWENQDLEVPNLETLKSKMTSEKRTTGNQETCEDAISRQAAIDAFERFIHELGIEDEPYNYGEIALSIQNVPPVTPHPKIGQWIQVESDKCKCDQCEVIQFIAMYPYGRKNYCPNCGAKMQDLPPVTPHPNIGHWVHNKCDKCGASRPPLLDNYCPNCGAKMQEVEE